MEIVQSEENKKRIKKKISEESLRELGDHQVGNIHMMESQKKTEKKAERLYKIIMAQNFPNYRKEEDIHI